MPQPDIRIDEASDRLRVRAGERELLDYVFHPGDPVLESPRPYLSPIRTLGGEVVSLYRPHDHVWHKGIAWSLPVVGDENFWGGPTFVRGEGYVQLPNNGAQRHRGFAEVRSGETGRVVEELDWITEAGATWFDERRELSVQVVDETTWVLGFATRMRNVSSAPIPIGSPTTRGRDNAGYGGLFWRGPRSFTGGTILAPGRSGGDELRGERAPWFGFTGRHDGTGAHSTIVMVDHPANVAHPPQWFARSDDFACLCPAPFFSEEHVVPAGGDLVERVAVVVADGDADPARAAELAEHGRAVFTAGPAVASASEADASAHRAPDADAAAARTSGS
ncbi:PmoA family protein [Agromyces sp. G08B096]|uniref:PmoA family protein n=1 Tax=Agromyces sp. G08B096 TaxID=3156399 RepID=A0AAU7W6D6_9MICO